MAKPAREQMYYVIPMPLDYIGRGPAEIRDAYKLTFEVWDQACMSYGSFDHLADAIDDMNSRNEEHERLLKQ